MRHKKLRTEQNCLNCGEQVELRFCTACGQENLELNDSAFHLIIHYFQDLFHYNGKFWHTIKHFLTRPGLVQEDYMAGKRQRHLNPIQFYVFASTIFFLVFFFVAEPTEKVGETPPTDDGKGLIHLNHAREYMPGSSDTLKVDTLITGLETLAKDTSALDSMLTPDFNWDLSGSEPDSSVSQGWLSKKITERMKQKTEEMNAEHQGDIKSAIKAFVKELLHSFPQLMFLSLPLFAFFLKLLYFRSDRKRYVANFIFSVYHYSYVFIVLLFFLLITWAIDSLQLEKLDSLWGWLTLAFVLYPLVYLYLSMKRFYQDSGFSLVLKFMGLMFLFLITLFILFLIISFLTFLI